MSIQITNPVRIAGVEQTIGTQLSLDPSLEADLVTRKCAIYLVIPDHGVDPVIRSALNLATGAQITSIWTGTKAEYDAIATKDANTEYVTDCGIYVGSILTSGYSQSDSGVDYIAYGLLLPSSGSTIGVASISAGVAYVSGCRVPVSGAVLALTPSKDNYVDVGIDRTVVVTPVTIGSGAPARAANSIRIGYVRTDATTVSATPTTRVKDSNGIFMGNTSPKSYVRVANTTPYGSGGSGVEYDIPFGSSTTLYDNDNLHSETVNNNRFTANSAGVYSIWGGVTLNAAGAGNLWQIRALKNGSSPVLGTIKAMDSQVLTLTFAHTIELAAGDYITVAQKTVTSLVIAAATFGMLKA